MMQVTRYYIGLHESDGTPMDREATIAEIGDILGVAGHDGFTIQDALGYWKGVPEPSLVLTIATVKSHGQLRTLASIFARHLNQDAVMLETANGVVEFVEASA